MLIALRFLFLVLYSIFYWLKYIFASMNKSKKEQNILRGQYIYQYLLKSGPVYIKMGQVLATRPDIIPSEIASELRKLQDDVPHMDENDTRRILKQEYSQPIEDIFSEFSFKPVASASIAQVHAAVLHTGQKVAVKVVKKNIRKQLEKNLKIIQVLVSTAHSLIPSIKHLNLPVRLQELKILLVAQADMTQEAQKQSAIYTNLKSHPYAYVPTVIKELCTSNILVMEFVEAIPGKNVRQVDMPPSKLARRLQHSIYTMLYLDGLCHGDPHPGNIFFTKDGKIIIVDFGITVELSEDEKWGLSSFYFACTRREWDIAVERFTKHFVTNKTNKLFDNWVEYQKDLELILLKHFDESNNRWSTVSFFRDFVVVLKKYGAQYTTNFTKVELLFLTCEGFLTQIDPDIDLWENARQFNDRYSPYMNQGVKKTFDEYFFQTSPSSLELRDRAKNSLVAPTHLDRYFFPSTYPIFVKKAVGSKIEDVDGNVYIDLSCGYGPHILGYGHPAITTALGEAVVMGGVNALGHLSEVQLAETIVEAFPGAEKAILSNSGSEAILQAIRLCRAYRQRDRIAKCEGHYHGFSDQGMVSSWFRVTGSKDFPDPISGTRGTHTSIVQNTLILQYGHLPSLARLREQANELACVVCEPMPSATAEWDRPFLTALRELCTDLDIPLIFDEVVSGFRVAYGGIQNLIDITPDLTCLGKIIGGGLPCGCVVGKHELIDIAKSSEDPFYDYEHKAFVGGTLSGNSLTCTAGLSVLTYLKEHPDIYITLQKQTDWLAQQFCQIAHNHAIPFQIKANRSIFSLTFSYKKVKLYREKWAGSNFKASIALAYYMRKYGVYMPELHFCMLNASHTQQDLETICQAFDNSLKEMVQDGFFVS
ncbi:aminotransferase [Nostoc sp. ATCC 43529]|nr:aminotransferase [Nostoc sp. ATCC 43529]